jgi:hypothetical protein
MPFHMESVREFFRDRVKRARRRRRLPLGETAEFYVVNLLADYLDAEKLHRPAAGTGDEEPIVFAYARALALAHPAERIRLFRSIGDRTLYVSGFFADSFNRKLYDIDYYVAMGERAYESVSSLSRDFAAGGRGFPELFGELAAKFVPLVDVLSEVSEAAGITSDADLLRLYERWLRTKSERLREKLVSQGILPVETGREPVH